MKSMKLRFMKFFVVMAGILLWSNYAFADLTGTWDMAGSYTRSDGSTGTGSNVVTMFQNGSEITADNLATSNNNRVGRIYGKIIATNPGYDTIANPKRLIEFTRTDISVGCNYVAIWIGFISDSDNYIEGQFIDVNGVKGTFTMTKR